MYDTRSSCLRMSELYVNDSVLFLTMDDSVLFLTMGFCQVVTVSFSLARPKSWSWVPCSQSKREHVFGAISMKND